MPVPRRILRVCGERGAFMTCEGRGLVAEVVAGVGTMGLLVATRAPTCALHQTAVVILRSVANGIGIDLT